ncbi:MAG TPA: hypothetical protein VF996_02125 [Candidatus Saccharimonadales bacterium]|jgi:Fic family protein
MWSVVLVVAAFAAGFWLAANGRAGRPAAVRAKRVKQKKQVLGLFASSDRIANNDVEKLLGVSDATATRILDEMEADGLVEAKGQTSSTYYVKS